MHALDTYLRSRGESLRSLAARAGTTATSLSRIINYQQTPSLGLVRRLVAASEGHLSADDFLAEAPPAPSNSEAAE